jgi:hypothetical protein
VGIRDHIVLLHGHRVRRLMAGDGPAMVLVHGIPSSADTWRAVMPALARRMRDAGAAMPALTRRVRDAGAAIGRLLGRLGLHLGPDLAEIGRGCGSLADPEARRAFVLTMRAVLDASRQRVSASERLYLTPGSERLAEAIEGFVADTEPADTDPERLRRLLLAGAS